MKRAFAIAIGALVAALVTVSVSAGGIAGQQSKVSAPRAVKQIDDLTLELVGQVLNSPPGVTPPTSAQYGYVSYLRGLPIFKQGPQNETTALFTFYTQTTTSRVISNGPLRIINREGTVTIYSDLSANGNFASPDSFRDGSPVLVAGLRQQVVLDTTTGVFTTHNLNTIISTNSFQGPSGELQLGKPGDRFTTLLLGRANAPGPGYMSGYTLSDSPKRGRP